VDQFPGPRQANTAGPVQIMVMHPTASSLSSRYLFTRAEERARVRSPTGAGTACATSVINSTDIPQADTLLGNRLKETGPLSGTAQGLHMSAESIQSHNGKTIICLSIAYSSSASARIFIDDDTTCPIDADARDP
jgi:hypothetical protein